MPARIHDRPAKFHDGVHVLTNPKSITKKYLFLAAVALGIAGCVEPPPPVVEVPSPPPCTIPSGYSIDKGISQGLKTMRLPNCGNSFDRVFEALLRVSAHRPGVRNRTKIVNFLEILVRENKIPFKKTNILFRTYFDKNLVAFSSSRKISFYRKKPEIISNLIDKEMVKKRVGFEYVMGLKKEFRQLQIRVKEFKSTFGILTAIK
ncbi:MAG TPA: hypothetical protein DDZ83_02570 [Nitrospinae bacterium]|nr:hypothetical protein [Nitrospinota bacterium]